MNKINRSKTGHGHRPRRFSVFLLMDWYDHEINRGISDYARQANWILEDASAHSSKVDNEWIGDGIIALATHGKEKQKIDFIRKKRIPAVDLTNESEKLILPRVLPDNHAIGRMAAEHFLSRGFENLAYYQAFDANVEEERMGGFAEAAKEKKKNYFHIDLSIYPHIRGRKRIERLGRMLKPLPKPIGIMGQYDYSAKELVYACEAAGLSVPEQVAIIGVDNNPISCEIGPIGLTSVDSNLYKRGYEAAALLDRLMKGRKAPKKPIRIPPKGVVVRQSSDILAMKNVPVEKALRYILINLNNSIKTDDIVAVSGVSRSMLYNLFRKHLRTSLKDLIMTERLKRVKELLVKTEDKLDAIAAETGFPNGNRLCKAFTREVGLPPYAFRKQEKGKDTQNRI